VILPSIPSLAKSRQLITNTDWTQKYTKWPKYVGGMSCTDTSAYETPYDRTALLCFANIADLRRSRRKKKLLYKIRLEKKSCSIVREKKSSGNKSFSFLSIGYHISFPFKNLSYNRTFLVVAVFSMRTNSQIYS
jgi:hypothetical protein